MILQRMSVSLGLAGLLFLAGCASPASNTGSDTVQNAAQSDSNNTQENTQSDAQQGVQGDSAGNIKDSASTDQNKADDQTADNTGNTAVSPNACGPENTACAAGGNEASDDDPAEVRRIYDQNVAGFKEISFDDAIAFLKDGKTGILYFGFPDCPWCEEVVPLLKEASEKADEKVYYIRTRDDAKERLYTDEQKEAIQPWIEEYMDENDEGILTLYVPLVLAVQDGQVVMGHESTVEGHDAKERKMTDQEKAEVQKIMEDIVQKAAA